jgi:hypothetical protein
MSRFADFLISFGSSLNCFEVVKHLTTLYGVNVQVTLEIEANIPGGVREGTVRTVTENCRALRFEGFAFEEE